MRINRLKVFFFAGIIALLFCACNESDTNSDGDSKTDGDLDMEFTENFDAEQEPEAELDLYEGNCEEYIVPRRLTACWDTNAWPDNWSVFKDPSYGENVLVFNGQILDIGQEPERIGFCSSQISSISGIHEDYAFEPGSKCWISLKDQLDTVWSLGLLGAGLNPNLQTGQNVKILMWQERDWGLGWLDLYVEDELVYQIFNTSTARIAEGLQHPDELEFTTDTICQQTRGTQANGRSDAYHELWVKHEQCWYVLQPGEVRYIPNTDWVVVFEQSSSISVWGEDNPYNETLYTKSPVALYKVDSDPTGTPLLNGFSWSNAPCQPVEE